jgi:hypothetical protein
MNKMIVWSLVILALIIGYQTQYVPEQNYKQLLKAIEAAEPNWPNYVEMAYELAKEKGYPIKKLESAVKEAIKKEKQRREKEEDKFNIPTPESTKDKVTNL